MMTKFTHCLVLLCCLLFCLLFCSVPAHAVTPEHFFSTAEEAGKMISFLVKQCDNSVECLKKARDDSYKEAMTHRKAQKHQDAFMAGQFSWYSAVYLGVVYEYLKQGGKNVDALKDDNFNHIDKLQNYFKIKSGQDFQEILKKSVDMVNAILDVAYEGGNSQSKKSQKR